MEVLGRELSSPVAGLPYREGIFSTWNDPAKFGLFYHAALITRRCDVSPASKKVAVFDGEKMLDIGKPPIMAEVIQANINIKTDIGDKLKVWGVNAEGFYSGRLTTTYENGIFSFTIGDEQNPACYYLIVKE